MNMKPRPEAIVVIAFDSIGRGTVRVNGVDLPGVVQATRIFARVGQATEVDSPDVTVHGDDFTRRAQHDENKEQP